MRPTNYRFRRTARSPKVCSTMLECITQNEGCPTYSKLVVSSLMALLMFAVAEYTSEQLVKHKYSTFGDVMVVTKVNGEPEHSYETKTWVKLMNICIAIVSFWVVYRHLGKASQ